MRHGAKPICRFITTFAHKSRTMNIGKVTTGKRIDYSLSEVVANLAYQFLMIFLVKLVADTFSIAEAMYAVLAFIMFQTVCRGNMISHFLMNKPAIALATLCTFIALGIRCIAIGYYFQDYVNQQALTTWLSQWGFTVARGEAYTTGLLLFMALSLVMQVLGIILFTIFMPKHIRKEELYIYCLAATALLTALCYMPQSDDISLIFLLSMIKSLVYAPTIPLLWMMACHAYDGEYGTPSRSYSVTSTIKLGLGLSGALTGLLLLSFGYSSKFDVLSWHTIQGIRWLSSMIPAMLFMISIAIMLLYPKPKPNDSSMLNYIDEIME